MDYEPTKHKVAWVVHDEGGEFHFEDREVPIPEIAPWEVLVKLSVSGVCGTDFAFATGHLGPSCDILGHEGVGHVVKLGAGVSTNQVQLNDRVGIAWVRDVCGKCQCCLTPGGEPRCRENLNSGRKIDGTFAEYAVVPARYVLKLPSHITVPDAEIAPILCGGVTAYKALKLSETVAGQWMAVSGAGGGVGALAIQYARSMGFRVLAIDAGQKKRELCLELGAEYYLDVLENPNLLDVVNDITRARGVSSVIVTAGSSAAYQAALDLLGPFGTLVCVGIPPPQGVVHFHPLTFIDKGIKIIGSVVGTRLDTLEALEFVQQGLVKPRISLTTLTNLTAISKDFASATSKYVIQF